MPTQPKRKPSRRYRYQQVHLLVQFTVVGGDRSTFLVRNVSDEFDQQLVVFGSDEKRLQQFYLALLRKSKGAEGRVVWNPDMVDVEGLTKIRAFTMTKFPIDYSTPGSIDVVL